MSARQFPVFGLLLTKEINPQKGIGGRRTAESETLISESRQENGFGLLVCGVGGREPGQPRAWAAEAIAVLAHRELQEAAQQSFGAVFQVFGSSFQSVGAFAGNIFQAVQPLTDSSIVSGIKDFFQNKRGCFNNAFALTAFFTADIFQGDGGQGNGSGGAFAAKRGAEADFATGYVKRVDDDFFAA